MPVLDAFVQYAVIGRYQPPPGANARTHIEKRKALHLRRGEARIWRKLIDALIVEDARLHELGVDEAPD